MDLLQTAGERIKARRNELRLSQRALGKLISNTAAAISLWENGSNQPNGENLLCLARVLKTSPEWLMTGSENIEKPIETNHPTHTNLRPIFNSKQALQSTNAPTRFKTENHSDWEEAPNNVAFNAFWFKVENNTMTTPNGISISEGHLVLVEPNTPSTNGDFVLVKLEGDKGLTFKQLVIDMDRSYLKPLNPTYHTHPMGDNDQIIGKVTEAKIKL